MTEIDFYYWGDQCPHNCLLRDRLAAAENGGLCYVRLHDFSADETIAAGLHIFSPNLLVIDGRIRWNGPLSLETLAAFGRGEEPVRPPYRVQIGADEVQGTLIELTEDTAHLAGGACAPRIGGSCCARKSQWISDLRSAYGLPHLGHLHLVNGECVGGAEFVPSQAVPYPIPKDADTAFLTCSYLSDAATDYKSSPLRRLEHDLPGLGFQSLLAVASEDVAFPNGPLSWFLDRGYADLGEIGREERDGAVMHLIRKTL